MTLIQQGLVTYLEAQVPSAGKGYPLEVPQDAAYPAWTYQVIDDEQQLAHSGGTGFHKARIQVDVMAEETASLSAYGNSAGIAALMRAALDGYQGNMGSVQVDFCKTVISDDFAELHQLPSVRFDVLINYRQ
jgi:hypothetical protein